MDFIRKIVNSNDLEKIISLPEELKHQNLEILVLPIMAKDNSGSQEKSKTAFNPGDFSGILKIKNIKDKINSLRDEWDRV